ncbi:MAG: Ribosomal RNA small subunit methyltransferase I [Chlamydiia bacterium]|nr:Ribosomal RNA small subunit methyltransferase I [Chlamydiia bacterium]MCH9615523.1 Ribosomal RNA small subunit methyltransferase I [Chlamydiia bacterium]MCH9629178.1 Ribosomal RNA small subunit methyltransferase I [Chlamydiia bacterium]
MELILLPNLLDHSLDPLMGLPAETIETVQKLDGLITETEKIGRHYLIKIRPDTFRDVTIHQINDQSDGEDIDDVLERIQDGQTWGYVSDCGLPCIADPGSQLIRRARSKQIDIKAQSGPSSVFLALMLSGLSGLGFTFHGYLPRKFEELKPFLCKLEADARTTSHTQIFIETPYRTQKTLSTMLACLSPDTVLSLAYNLSLPEQGIITQTVAKWKQKPLPDIGKVPAVFLFSSPKIPNQRKNRHARKQKQPYVFHHRRRCSDS